MTKSEELENTKASDYTKEFILENTKEHTLNEKEEMNFNDWCKLNNYAQKFLYFFHIDGKSFKPHEVYRMWRSYVDSLNAPTEDEIIEESKYRQLEGAEPFSFESGARWALSKVIRN
jgi:hypothetical protein